MAQGLFAAVTSRFVIVCLPSILAVLNDTLRNINPTSVGDPLQVKLTTPGDPDQTVVAYWCSWAMDETTNQALRAAVRDAGWQPKPTMAELTIHTPASLPNVPALGSGQRMWLFDGLLVPAQQVLETLGLVRLVRVAPDA